MSDSPARILCIDDDDADRMNLVAYLEDSGYIVLEAANGRAGLDVFRAEHPDLILVDLRMPVMGGMEVVAHMREEAPGVPVIVVSGAGILEEAVEALRRGAWDYVTKPVLDMRVLEHAVMKALERARLLDERQRYQERLEFEVEARTRELRVSNEQLRSTQSELEDKSLFLETLIESLPNPLFYKTLDGVYIGCNKAFSQLLGIPREKMVGRSARDLLPDHAYAQIIAGDCPSGSDAGEHSCVFDILGADGHIHTLALYKSTYSDSQGQVSGIVGTFLDITELKRKEAQIVHQATHDELTGLLNRFGMRQHVDRLIVGGQMSFALLVIDLDDFKTINDSLGHALGDRLLHKAAERIVELVGSQGIVGRPGGDEYVVLLYNVDAEAAHAMARRILDIFTDSLSVSGHEVYISLSIGIAVYPEDGDDAANLFKCCDIAMYRAKEEGGARAQRYLAAMQDVITSRLALEKNLRKALERGEFVLHYQPKVDIRTGAVTGMEALVRWVRDDGTIVPPQDFIPVAEKTGLIVALGEFVLREACRQMHAWQKRFGRLKMAVNISARQFQPGLPDTVASALADAGLDPGLLELEITETTMMRDLALTVSVLERLTTGGIAVAIDDFGTGHSSLYYLKTFPISSIRIDRSFVRDIPNDETDATIVTTVVSMGRNLGIGIVAEGVETEAQLDFLRSLECPEVQGYYFSKPLPPHAFEAWMENRLRV